MRTPWKAVKVNCFGCDLAARSVSAKRACSSVSSSASSSMIFPACHLGPANRVKQ